MSMMLNSSVFGLLPSGIQYVGGYTLRRPGEGSGGPFSHDLTGNLTGGIASSPAAGDFGAVCYSIVGTADRTGKTIATATDGTFDLQGSAYANDITDTSITIRTKFFSSSDDTLLVEFAGSVADSNPVYIQVQVWRGVNVTTPMDVAAVISGIIDTGQPNPGSITPVTAGAYIAVFGASGNDLANPATFTSSDLTGFTTAGYNGSARAGAVGMGYKEWTSGAFNPAQWGGGDTSTRCSSAQAVLALRPA